MEKETLISSTTIVTQKKSLDTTYLDSEVVMMDIDKGKYYNFNLVGSRIWEVIQNPISVEDIVTKLMEEFEVDKDNCSSAVISFLDRLLNDDLITLA